MELVCIFNFKCYGHHIILLHSRYRLGKVREIIRYLLRRAQENGDVLENQELSCVCSKRSFGDGTPLHQEEKESILFISIPF